MKITKDKIIEIMNSKGATEPCHRCGSNEFSVIEGFSQLIIQDDTDIKGIVLGGPTVPVALVGCNNCGAITPHALGALGLLPEQDEEGRDNE